MSVSTDVRGDRLPGLGMLASALAGRAVAVVELPPGERSWTDGQTIHVDAGASARGRLEAVAVQASMIAAGSLDPELMRRLLRHPRLAKRYLAVEGHRALIANSHLMPGVLASLGDRDIAIRSDSPDASLRIADGRAVIDDPKGIRRHPGGEGVGGVRPGGRTTRRRRSRACAQEPRFDAIGRTRRRRDRRFGRSRHVHQPGGRWRFHRQVAEEDAVVGAQDR